MTFDKLTLIVFENSRGNLLIKKGFEVAYGFHLLIAHNFCLIFTNQLQIRLQIRCSFVGAAPRVFGQENTQKMLGLNRAVTCEAQQKCGKDNGELVRAW